MAKIELLAPAQKKSASRRSASWSIKQGGVGAKKSYG
jgi:hypothetical protein